MLCFCICEQLKADNLVNSFLQQTNQLNQNQSWEKYYGDSSRLAWLSHQHLFPISKLEEMAQRREIKLQRWNQRLLFGRGQNWKNVRRSIWNLIEKWYFFCHVIKLMNLTNRFLFIFRLVITIFLVNAKKYILQISIYFSIHHSNMDIFFEPTLLWIKNTSRGPLSFSKPLNERWNQAT